MKQADLVIKEPKKPLLNRVLVALLYACLFTYTIYLFFYKNIWSHPKKWTILILLCALVLILFLSTFRSIASHSIHINSKKYKIQHQYHIGLFRYKEVWQDIVAPEYISVFHVGNQYQVNLWYDKRGILNLMALKNCNEAFDKGLFIAEKMNIDLLDARELGNHRWVDKKSTKEKGSIVYFK